MILVVDNTQTIEMRREVGLRIERRERRNRRPAKGTKPEPKQGPQPREAAAPPAPPPPPQQLPMTLKDLEDDAIDVLVALTRGCSPSLLRGIAWPPRRA